MDRSIRYVREHKVAPMLNDMLTHLLISQASDPIDALIIYLEKRQGLAAPKQQTVDTPASSNETGHEQRVVDVGLLTGIDEIVAEILRGEHNAQILVEKAAASLPRTALAAQPLLERFHKNSQRIAALAQALVEGLGCRDAPVAPAGADPVANCVADIRREALDLERRLNAWLTSDSNTPNTTSNDEARTASIQRALRQQEVLLSLLSQL